MIPNLTPAVARALEAADIRARSAGAQEVEPVHLFQALLAEDEGLAVTVLTRSGLSLETLRRAFPNVPVATTPSVGGPQFILSSVTLEILSEARQLADDVSADRTVASDHLVLALVRKDGQLLQQLTDMGLCYSRLETAVCTYSGPSLVLDEPLRLADAGDEMNSSRILDAGSNRAREALRVIEDYCRFSMNDKFLTEQAKQLRHDLCEILANFPFGVLLEARDTEGDVGTAVTTAREQTRSTLLEVVRANLKRLQEALRSLEEYGKLRGARWGRRLEKLRYRSYTLERAVLLGHTSRERLADACLYVLVSGSRCLASLEWTIQEAIAGGSQIIQLREKNLSDQELLERACKVRRWTAKSGVLFIMNDRPDVARLAGADGVHLGQEDLPIMDARRVVGPDALVGVSTHNLEQLRQAVLDGANYVAAGPVFPSTTKNFVHYAGLDFVKTASQETSLPTFAIGGVNVDNIDSLVKAGARRAAVSQAICGAEDPRAAAQQLRRVLSRTAPAPE
jgi:thiamine-phosphate pyrophosphorylase